MEVRGRVVVRVENLSYEYEGGVKALDRVNLEVREGEVLAVLGPNGAGKTTLLKCILGLLKPRGNVYIDGGRIDKLKPRERARKLGYVPQTHYSVFSYRIIDFVLMGRAPHHSILSIPSGREVEKALKILDELGISGLAYRCISEVSGGQMQLVLIARALVQDAEVLLLDEPTAHLDLANQVRVLSMVRSLVKSGRVKAAIITLHDPAVAAVYSDKVVLLKDGRVVAYGSPSKVLSERILESVYDIRFRVVSVDGLRIPLPKPHVC